MFPITAKFALDFSTRRLIAAWRDQADYCQRLSDEELARQAQALGFAARRGTSIRHTALKAFPLVMEAIRRCQSICLHDQQLVAAWNLCQRNVVQMATGEGKTLTAHLPLVALALYGKGVVLTTANDYLVERDSAMARQTLDLLGLSVGAVLEPSTEKARREAYHCDVTYATANQVGFDFLRDRARRRINESLHRNGRLTPVGREYLFAVIVDEVDSLLIDNAATPLALATNSNEASPKSREIYRWAARLASEAVEGEHFSYRKVEQRSELTAFGQQWLHQASASLGGNPDGATSLIDRCEFVERAISVERNLLKDRDYLIAENQIHLIDQETGRVGVGREWAEGVQQAIQAKEGLPITVPNGQLARVTIQSLFQSVGHLSGMTGTATPAKQEFKKNYGLDTKVIQTHLPCKRVEYTTVVARDQADWLEAIWSEAIEITQLRRALLIGTRDILQSEVIADYFVKNGRSVQLLNAKQDAREAHIIAQAGTPSQITIATNMAGRGTDIKLDPSVRESGGLHIIVAAQHASKRIDRQLVGRCARQGDPGSFRIILNIDDSLLDEAYSASHAARIRRGLARHLSIQRCLRVFHNAQSELESRQKMARDLLFNAEKKQLKAVDRTGMDPLLDCPV